MTELFQQIQAMHQQVREFVEAQEPEFKVTSIDAYPTTTYMAPLHALGEIDPKFVDFVLTSVNLRFRVEALRLAGHMRLNCEVFVMSDGGLYFANPIMSR